MRSPAPSATPSDASRMPRLAGEPRDPDLGHRDKVHNPGALLASASHSERLSARASRAPALRAAPSTQEEPEIAMSSRTRQQNVSAAQWSANGDALGTSDLTQPGAEIYGENTFSPAVQKARLPKDVYRKLEKTLATGEALDPSLADAVAKAMREWAMEKGATHYTHWFQPLTGLTAEKHDSFFE